MHEIRMDFKIKMGQPFQTRRPDLLYISNLKSSFHLENLADNSENEMKAM